MKFLLCLPATIFYSWHAFSLFLMVKNDNLIAEHAQFASKFIFIVTILEVLGIALLWVLLLLPHEKLANCGIRIQNIFFIGLSISAAGLVLFVLSSVISLVLWAVTGYSESLNSDLLRLTGLGPLFVYNRESKKIAYLKE